MLRQGPVGQAKSLKSANDGHKSQAHNYSRQLEESGPSTIAPQRSYSETQVYHHPHIHSDGDILEHEGEHSQDLSDEEDTFVFEGHEVGEVPISVAETIYKRRSLRKLSSKGNKLRAVPAILGSLSSLYYSNLSNNKFSEVPPCVSELKSLEILDMSNNELRGLPNFLGTLKNLIGLSLVHNKIEVLPPVIADLPKLVILELADNPLQLPDNSQPSDDLDEEQWIASLRLYIMKQSSETEGSMNVNHRDKAASAAKTDNSSQANLRGSERARSASESGISLRSSKRMGFVMSRNATDQSYVASLHARGASYDAHALDSSGGPITPSIVGPYSSTSSGLTPNTPTGSIPSIPENYVHGRSLSNISGGSVPSDLSTPRSPVARSPYGSPWGSPRPSFAEMEPQNTTTSRSSTLAEEHDVDNAETDMDSPTLDSGSKKSMHFAGVSGNDSANHEHSEDGRNSDASTYLFKDSYQEHGTSSASSLSNRGGSISSSSFRRTSDEVLENTKSGSIPTPKSPVYPNSVLEKIREALHDFGEFLVKIVAAIPKPLAALLTDSMELLSQENWYLTSRAFSNLLDKSTVPAVFQKIMTRSHKRQQRQFAMTIMYTFPDLEAAWRLIQQSKLSPLSMDTTSTSWVQDEHLHAQLNFAIKQTQEVLSSSNNLVSKSAVAAADTAAPSPTMANRVRDLSSVCIRCSSATREVKKFSDKSTSGQARNLQMADRRHFWEDVNTFLKSVVNILAAIKSALPDMPSSAEKRVGVEVASLTRVAKEIPPLSEQSSYRLILDTTEQSTSETNEFTTPGMSLVDLSGLSISPPPTPLTATLGPAAQALVSPSERAERPGEGYIQYGIRAHANSDTQ